MYKGAIFDLDGTLYDYDICVDNAEKTLFNFMQKTFNLSLDKCIELLLESKNEVKSNLIDSASSHNRFLYIKTICEKLNVNSVIYTEIMYNIYWDSFFEKMNLFDFVLPLFRFLKDNKIKIGILTDLTTKIQFKKINKLQISNDIDCIVTSEEVGVDKPNKKMFETIIKKMNLSKNDILMLGDDIKKDIDGAKNFGISALLINKYSNLYDIISKVGS